MKQAVTAHYAGQSAFRKHHGRRRGQHFYGLAGGRFWPMDPGHALPGGHSLTRRGEGFKDPRRIGEDKVSTAEEKGATERRKSGPVCHGEELVPVVHGRAPRADRSR